MRAIAFTVVMIRAIGASLVPASAAEMKAVKLELKAGQALTFPAAIVDGKVTLGPAQLGKFGEEQPHDGEITVGLSPKDKTLYENVTVVEKTAVPVDLMATGLVGNIKIDEIVLHGRTDVPVTARIGATSWSVWLNSFEVGTKSDTH